MHCATSGIPLLLCCPPHLAIRLDQPGLQAPRADGQQQQHIPHRGRARLQHRVQLLRSGCRMGGGWVKTAYTSAVCCA